MEEPLFEVEKLVAPQSIIGQHKTAGGYTKTTPREWTQLEIDWVQERKKEGYTIQTIAEALDRSAISVQIKMKRLGKSGDTYNQENRRKKYLANEEFLQIIKPDSILDVYAGQSWWKGKAAKVVTNDTDKKFETDFSMDALDLLCTMRLERKKFDIVDLDPYGSAYDQFDLATKIAKKGLVVSFGEYGHKRWKRIDYVEPRYAIQTLEEYGDGEKFVLEIQRIAACNKKIATPVISCQYSNFLRVYFVLHEKKITEQWEGSSL